MNRIPHICASCLLIVAGLLSIDVPARNLAEADITVLGIAVDLDTRPDLDGIQTSASAVRNVPSGVLAFVGGQGVVAVQSSLPGTRVRAELSGPAFGSEVVTLTAAPGQLMELPPLGAAGEYQLFNVRLEDSAGNIILRRDPTLDSIVITVIEELLVTQVVSRPLTLDEIVEKGIVIDEDNFTVLNFTIGLTLGSQQVVIDLPVAVPKTEQAGFGKVPIPQFFSLPSVRSQFEGITIPNFSLSGFQMIMPPELEEALEIKLPAINGVIIIPGNIAFLNQFFSVVLQATNVAPEGSGLVLQNAQAQITLPTGEDEILDTGDDPLRIAETQSGGVQAMLPLLHPDSADAILPTHTNDAEFLIEGLREGAYVVNFDITGDLFVPALGETVPLAGAAAGVVQVKNPSFDIVLAHPDVVRDGEAYSLFATVTNTSSSPANLFQLKLDGRRLTGAKLDEGETGLKTLESLAPGEAESFEFHLVARTTGQVSGTVFLADEGINGSFILTTGVGDTGIPLSPDTLILPQTVDYLPNNPDLVFAAVRMLGQAYSVATAPAGALPPEIARIRRSYVFDRAVKLAQAGLHIRFGESEVQATRDILMNYLGSDLQRIAELYPDDNERERQQVDMRAFDGLRRAADAGNDLSDVFAGLIGQQLDTLSLPQLQLDWAQAFASRSPHLSFGISSRGPPALLQMNDADGNRLGRLTSSIQGRREIPFADRLPLSEQAELLFIAAPQSESYLFEFAVPAATDVEPALILPAPDGGMLQIIYPEIAIPAGAVARMRWVAGTDNDYSWEIDHDGDGSPEQTLTPTALLPVDDLPPTLLGVHQWGKGAQPATQPSFAAGDPIGRMVGVLFSEEVDANAAAALTAYEIPGNRVVDVSLQPDRRLAFIIFKKPLGPFVPRQLTASGVSDRAGQIMSAETHPITPDPDRGIGGNFTGHVLTADGRSVPFATVSYIQPLSFKDLFETCFGDFNVKDFVIATYLSDAQGRFSIDYVLQSGFPDGCPTNADIWLNESGAGGTLNFKLEAIDPETGNKGGASSRVQFDGQSLNFDVIIRGFGSIEGRVFDEDGNLVAGGDPGSGDELYVIAQNVSTGGQAASWVDAQGYYVFPRSFASENGGSFDAPGLRSGNVILRSVRPSDGATAIASTNIPAEGTTIEQDLVLVDPSRYGGVSGRVLEADGVTGAANVPVQVGIVVGREASVVGSTATDSEGAYSFEQVPAGAIEVRATRQSTFEEARARSFLAEGETSNVVLIFPGGGGTVRGIVRDAFGNPIANAAVAGGPTLTSTDENGFFEITGLPLGTFTIFGQGSGSLALGQIEVETLGPDDIQNVVITLQPTGSVGGTIYEADGITPIVGQKVQLWFGTRGVMAESFTTNSGQFRFGDFPLGTYSIRAVREDHGDGGMANAVLRFAGDERDADIVFRGLGEIKGRVIQSNGTPVLSDVIITRKVWRILTDPFADIPNVYLDFLKEIAEISEDLEQTVDRVLTENNLNQGPAEFFYLVDEAVLLKSDILGPNGEVTGEFHFPGPATGGPFKVAAFGPFLSPTEVTGEIPKTTDPAERIVDVGDIVLEPSTGTVRGTIYMPDGETPVGENVLVKLRSLGSSGKVLVPGGGVTQPILPELDVLTDANGEYGFPLALRGNFVLSVDSGVPDPAIRADTPAEMETEQFADADGNRLLNVRLFGQATGVVPLDEVVTLDVRLHDVAGVQVQVVESDGLTPVPFAEVSLSTASTLDSEFEEASQNLVADEGGMIDYFPVIEGMFSVRAKEPASPSRGQANGDIPLNPPNGFTLPITVTLGAVTTASGEIIVTSIFGSVEGTVLAADGTPLTNPSQITVSTSGIQILTTSDVSGHYRAEDVPGGFFKAEAFEPFTARRGNAMGNITFEEEIVDLPIMLAGLGTVTGEVLSNDGSQMIAAVDVALVPSGNFTEKLVGRTNNQGVYSLPGVPVGSYRVNASDPGSGLSGASNGSMEADAATATTDIYLEPSGSIGGIVYLPGVLLDADGQPVDESGAPLPDPPVAASASVTVGGRVVQTGADGRFASGPYLLMGNYQLTARALSGKDGATADTRLTFEGQVAEVPMVMRGTGVVDGIVLNSTGDNPVTTAQVTLYSQSPFAGGAVTRFSEIDGSFLFEEVPVGEFSISVRTTLEVPQLGGGVSASIASHGDSLRFIDGDADTAHNAIRLQQAGDITGQILLSDGVSFADGAVVQLAGNGLQLSRVADPGGVFLFEGVPLGVYQLTMLESSSNGVAARAVDLSVNGELIDLGEILLDDGRPFVTSLLPASDSSGIDPIEPIVARFNELIDAASVSEDTFEVLVGGELVAGSYNVSATEPEIEFLPSVPLPDLRQIQVTLKAERLGFQGEILETGIRDLAGLGMLSDVSYVFMTGDSMPPAIVSLSPADGSIEVSLASVVRFEFSEPLTRDSIAGFTLTIGGNPVAGTLNEAPILGDRVFVFTPDAILLPNAMYIASMEGPLADLSGNTMDEAAVSTRFQTLDTLAPVIDTLTVPTGTAFVQGGVVSVTAELSDTDVAAVEFYLENNLIATDAMAPYTASVILDPTLGSSTVVNVIATDVAGNRSELSSLPITIGTNQPPSVEIVAPSQGVVSVGALVTLRVQASDDIGLSQLSYSANAGVVAAGAKVVSTTSVEETFSFTVPESLLRGDTITLRAAAQDSLGLVAESGTVVLTVEDLLPPTVTFLSPADNSQIVAGATLDVSLRAEDGSGLSRLVLETSGVLVSSQERLFDPAVTPVTVDFELAVPAEAPAAGELVLTARATDTAGNTRATNISVYVQDITAPEVGVSKVDGTATVSPGATEALLVSAVDDIGATRIELFIDDASVAVRNIAANPDTEQIFNIDVPGDLPLGGQLTVVAVALDAAGNRAESAPLLLTASDQTGPVATILAPEDGSIVLPDSIVDVDVTASDNIGVTSLRLTLGGALSGTQQVNFEPVPGEVSHTFNVDVPAETPSGALITIEVTATDGAELTGVASIELRLADRTPPEFLVAVPADGATGVPLTTRPSVTFSEALAPATVIAANVSLATTAGEGVTGQLVLSQGERTITLVPDAELALATEYRLTVTDAIADPAGNTLATALTITFTTDTGDIIGPRLLELLPGDGAVGISIRPVIRANFDEAILDASVTDQRFQLLDAVDNVVAATSSVDGGIIELRPSTALEFDSAYRVRLSGQISDASGNLITDFNGEEFSVIEQSFTTGSFAITSPEDGETVIENTVIALTADTGAGLGLADVLFEVNGQPLPADTTAPYSVNYTVPAATLVSTLEITAIGRDAAAAEVVRATVSVDVAPGLQVTPSLLGVPLGGEADMRLSLSKALLEDLPVQLSTFDATIAGLSGSTVVISAGQTVLDITVSGLTDGATTIIVNSAQGDGAVVASVSEPENGAEILVASSIPGISVSSIPIVAELVFAGAGTHTVEIVLLEAPAGSDLPVLVTSLDPLVADVTDLVVIAAGSRVAAFNLVTGDSGQTDLRLVYNGQTVLLRISVGAEFADAVPGIISQAVGISVSNVPLLTELVFVETGARVVDIVLLDEPALSDMTVLVTSPDPSIVDVTGPVVIPAGSRIATFNLLISDTGQTDLRLVYNGQTILLRVSVGAEFTDAVPVVTSHAVGISVSTVPLLTELVFVEAGARAVEIVMLDEPAVSDVTVLVTSPDPSIADVTGPVIILAGSRTATFNLLTGDTGQTDLRLVYNGQTILLRVSVGAEFADVAPGITSLAVGISISNVPLLTEVVFVEAGAKTVEIVMLDEPAPADINVQVTSPDPSIADVTGPVIILAGSRTATFNLLTGDPGQTDLRLVYNGQTLLLRVSVGAAFANALPGITSQAVGISIREGGTAGKLIMPISGALDITLSLLSGPAGQNLTVFAVSRDPDIADVNSMSAVIPAGGREAQFTIITGVVEGKTLIELDVGGELTSIEVIVGLPEEADVPYTVTPVVGVEVAE